MYQELRRLPNWTTRTAPDRSDFQHSTKQQIHTDPLPRGRFAIARQVSQVPQALLGEYGFFTVFDLDYIPAMPVSQDLAARTSRSLLRAALGAHLLCRRQKKHTICMSRKYKRKIPARDAKMTVDEWVKTREDGRKVKFMYQELPDDGAFITAQIAGNEVVYSIVLTKTRNPLSREDIERHFEGELLKK
jgi:hypothetical protein